MVIVIVHAGRAAAQIELLDLLRQDVTAPCRADSWDRRKGLPRPPPWGIMPGPMRWAGLLVCAAAAVAGGLAVGSGCDPGPIYSPDPPALLGRKVTPKERWSASGTLSKAGAAIDGDLSTLATTGYRYAGAQLTIDLKEMCVFEAVIIDHGREQHGHARRVAVATSRDGKTFKEQYAAHGSRRVTHLLIPHAVLARYVRLKVVTPGRRPWAIAEVYVQ